MEDERWAPISAAPGYEISDRGSIRNRKGKMLRPGRTPSGYLAYSFTTGPKQSVTLRVHRVVAEAFIPNPENKAFVDHIDGQRDNNLAPNLMWVTPSENSKKAVRRGGWGRKVVQLSMEGAFLRTWDSAVQASAATGAQRSIIANCCQGTTRNRSSGGYKWAYADEYFPPDPLEEWRQVQCSGIDWEVSSHGRVKTQIFGGITLGTLIGGYMTIKDKRRGVSIAVHRLVATAFCPKERECQSVVNHKDGIKTNNTASNLEWATQKENMQHASDASLIKRRVTPVRQHFDGGTDVDYPSIAEAARRTGIAASNICSACQGKQATAGGFKWTYVDAARDMDEYVVALLEELTLNETRQTVPDGLH